MVGIFLASLCFILWDAIIDKEHISKKEYINNHVSRSIMRGTYFVTIGMFNVYYGLASLLLFAALFDQILNIALKKRFWYLGTVAKWDIFFNNRKWLYITVKLVVFATSIAIFLFN